MGTSKASFDSNRVLEFTEKLKSRKTASEKWEVMNRELENCGFTGSAYLLFPSIQRDDFVPEMLYFSTYNEEFVRLYTEEGLAADDYAAMHCINDTRPAIWSDIKQKYTTPRQRVFDEIATDYKLHDGLIIPFHEEPGFFTGGLGMAFDIDAEDEAHAYLEQNADTIISMCHLFDQQMKDPAMQIDALRLSPRHLECLRYLCLGMSDKEIANKMNLRPKTVENYVGTAMKRLKVRNRHHATAKAIMLGIVQP